MTTKFDTLIWMMRANVMPYPKLVATSLAVILLASSPVAAHEAYLSPHCKQGTCLHTLIRNIQPVAFLESGMLIAYEAKSIDVKCSENGISVLSDECFKNKPDFNSSTEHYIVGYAFCSIRDPVHLFRFRDPTTKQQTLLATYLDPAGLIPAYHVWSIQSYFAVCHGATPRHSLDEESFKKYVVHLGYKPLRERNGTQRRVSSVPSFLRTLNLKSTLEISWAQRWYLDDVTIIDQFFGGEMKEVKISLIGADRTQEMSGVLVNCNAGNKQVKLGNTNYSFEADGQSSEETPQGVPLGDVWRRTCR